MSRSIYRRAGIAMMLMLLLAPCVVTGQTSGSTPKPAPKKESFWQKVLRITGISASPGTLRGPGDDIRGQIWIADLETGVTRPFVAGGGAYGSPIFVAGSHDVLALKGEELLRFPAVGGEPARLCTIRGITKVVGVSMDDASTVLILAGSPEGSIGVKLLSMDTCKTTTLAYDPASIEDRHMLEQLMGSDRVYGDKSVFVRRQTNEGFAGPVEWTDVFLKIGDGDPRNVSKCDGVDCGQPALSSDGRLLAFVRKE